MVKKKQQTTPEIEAWFDSRHSSLEWDGRLYTEGDSIVAALPRGGKNRSNKKVTFVAYITPEGKESFVEVKDRLGVSRCIRITDIKKGGKKL